MHDAGPRGEGPSNAAEGDDADIVRVAVIDEQPIVHGGVAAWCATTPLLAMVGGYVSIDDFEAAAPDPDVVVLGLQYGSEQPDVGSIGRLADRGFRVVVFSRHVHRSVVLRSLDHGAAVHLSKSEGREQLTAAVLAAAADEPYLSPTMSAAMNYVPPADRPMLSAREREVLFSWFRTESKETVASDLFITVGTVNTHLKRIRAKYAAVGRPATTKASLVARAIQDELISPADL